MAYSTVALIRESTLQAEDTFTNTTGTTLTFNDNYSKSMISVTKNGSVIATGWAFTAPNTLTLTTGLITSDVIQTVRAIHLTDAQLTNIQTRVDAWIDTYLVHTYPLPFSATPPQIIGISTQVCQARALQLLSTKQDYNVNDKELDYAQGVISDAANFLDAIASGHLDLADSSGNRILRIYDYQRRNTVYCSIDDSTIPS